MLALTCLLILAQIRRAWSTSGPGCFGGAECSQAPDGAQGADGAEGAVEAVGTGLAASWACHDVLAVPITGLLALQSVNARLFFQNQATLRVRLVPGKISLQASDGIHAHCKFTGGRRVQHFCQAGKCPHWGAICGEKFWNFYIILYDIILYYIILYYIILYYIILYYIIVYYIILYYIILYYIILYHIVLYCVIFYSILLCCSMLYYVALYFALLYNYVVLY